jgi:hypothetical protein
MDLRELRRWVQGLDQRERGRALAAIGVAAAHGDVRRSPDMDHLAEALNRAGRGAADLQRLEPMRCHSAVGRWLAIPARHAAEAWQQADVGWGARLELWHEGSESPAWLAAALAHPDVGLASVYVRQDHPVVDVSWGWPLRVGLLPDQRSVELRGILERGLRFESWIDRLVRPVDATLPDSDCDLLLLPHAPRDALRIVTELRSAPYADCIIVLSAWDESDRAYGLLSGLRSAARTSGVALVGMEPTGGKENRAWPWFSALIAELSHDSPIDVALRRAAPDGELPPLLSAARRLVDQGRLRHRVQRMAEMLDEEQYRSQSMYVKGDSATANMGPAGDVELGRIGEMMASRSDDHYGHETDMATVVVEVGEAMAAAAPDAPADERFIQAQVLDVTDPDRPELRKHSLRPRAPHDVVVRVGPPEANFHAAPESFPDHELPTDVSQHELTVVFTDLRAEMAPQVARITLPWRGPSTTARFHTAASPDGDLHCRIAVLHRNRILQTALLRAPVGNDRVYGEGIVIDVEAVVRPAIGELDGRSYFDAALILNHTPDGAAAITGIAGDTARSFRVSPQIAAVITALDNQLTNVAFNRMSFDSGLRGDAFGTLLCDLAQIGSALWQHVVHDGIGSDSFADAPRLHVLSALADARLPVEFIYDRAAPDPGAPLCSGAEQALASGSCNGACPAADAQHTVVCPLGFWGLSRVIERHAHAPDLARNYVGVDDFSFRSEPVRARDTLDVLRCTLVGSNYRVENSAGAALQSACTDLTGRADPVRSWQDWKDAVAQKNPSLLLLIVHSETAPNVPLPRIEIGSDDWVMAGSFRGSYLRPSGGAPKPLLLLLGCETGSPPVDFGGFIASARTHGAAIVVAAGAMIHSVHAVEVATEIVAALRREIMARPDATFGDVFLAVRRDLIARGRPMILTLNAYGDADWHLA